MSAEVPVWTEGQKDWVPASTVPEFTSLMRTDLPQHAAERMREMKGEHGDKTMSRQSVWSLSPDGAVLTIETTLQTPRGVHNIKSVYTRS